MHLSYEFERKLLKNNSHLAYPISGNNLLNMGN